MNIDMYILFVIGANFITLMVGYDSVIEGHYILGLLESMFGGILIGVSIPFLLVDEVD